MEIREELNDEDEGIKELQESYNSLLEKTREYARVAKAAIKKRLLMCKYFVKVSWRQHALLWH